ncbi:MAG: acetyl-CoA carboxylase carboxyltransferase subunit alpha [Acidobacteria bacterium]|nr:acetyl-CoA carboxylase carboxyltransferase subunit alpha [Acidobacteriota bacterium]MYE42770.1 acetyl-CoA carboxylase carboxyltransferase subunit alpha [Acidobacteriota bacterium]
MVQREFLDFEADIQAIVQRIEALTGYPDSHRAEIAGLERELLRRRERIYAGLTPWQRVRVARHPERPYSLDYVNRIFTGFTEIHGDRRYADDPAVIGGPAWLAGAPVMVIGQQKGRDTAERIHRNYGMPRPEGYRKALRLMKMAEKFGRPVIALVDTPGAFPGIEAEERGQAEAIARNLREMARLDVPVVVAIIGEGGSGGALGIAVGDRILMMENAIYSVISPEGCAAILWKDPERAHAATEEAAARMRVTAPEHLRNGLIDEIVPEPPGGAHTDHDGAAELLGERLRFALRDVAAGSPADRREARYRKFRDMGNFGLEEAPSRTARDSSAPVDKGAAGGGTAGYRPANTG